MLYDVANGLRYCPGCHRATAVVLNHASGDTVCSGCGLVLGERYVDESSEWRTFANVDDGGHEGRDRSRIGGAADHFLTHTQLGTTIAYPAPHNVQLNTSADHAEGAGFMRRMRGAVSAGAMPRMRGAVGGAGIMPRMRGVVVGPPPDKALVEASHSIDDMADRLGLMATVKDRAKEVFKKLEEAKAFPKGGKCRNRDALYAACLHVACRAEGTPRTFKELASVTGDGAMAGMKDIGRLVKHIRKHLGEEDGKAVDMGAVVRAGDYLRRFGSLLGMGTQEVRAAQEAARRLEDGLDVRRNPDSIAAAVIYMAIQRTGVKKSIRDVSTATGVSDVTIREVYHKDLYPHAELLFG